MLWTDRDGKVHFTVPEHGFIEGAEGAHVLYPTYGQGRDLLGEVVSQQLDQWGDLRLEVKFFNGEPWPFRPLARVVTVLERTYDTDPPAGS